MGRPAFFYSPAWHQIGGFSLGPIKSREVNRARVGSERNGKKRENSSLFLLWSSYLKGEGKLWGDLLVKKNFGEKESRREAKVFLVIFFLFRSLTKGSFYLKKRGSKEIEKKGF